MYRTSRENKLEMFKDVSFYIKGLKLVLAVATHISAQIAYIVPNGFCTSKEGRAFYISP